MKGLTEEFVKQYTELRDDCLKMIPASTIFDYMSTQEFEILQRSIRLVNTALDIVVKQAMIIDEMNNKLSKLLENQKGSL